MGAPPNPIDGQQYAELLLGVPLVLEYDDATGGFKQVIDIETGVAINISGTVEVTSGQITVVLGGQYGEDTPHTGGQTGTFILGVRNDGMASMVDADGDYGAFQLNSFGLLKTVISSPVGVTNTPSESNPTGVYTISHLKAYRDDSDIFARLMGYPAAADNIDNDNFAFNLNVNSVIWGVNGGGDFDRIRGTREAGLHVTMISGSWPTDALSVDTELPAAAALADDTANPTVPGVGAFLMAYDRVDDNWDRWPAGELRADFTSAANEAAPVVHALVDGISGNILRRIEAVVDSDEAAMGSAYVLATAAGLRAYSDVTGDWDRLRGSKEIGLHATMVSGSLPGQAAAIEIDDTIAGALRAGIVGAANLMYDVVGGNWERDPARLWASGLAAPVAPQRISLGMHYNYATANARRNYGQIPNTDAVVSDEVFSEAQNVAAVLYSKRGNETFDRLRGDKETGLNVTMVSGSWPTDPLQVNLEAGDIEIGAVEIKNADSELRAAVNVLADAMTQPTGTLAVGAFGMVYDIAGGDWDRDPARVPADGMTAAVFPQRVAFNEYFDYNSGNWQRIYGGDLSADAIGGGGGGSQLDNSLNARAALLGHRGNDTFDRMIGTKETGLNVSMISGSWPTDPLTVDTELPAAVALSDGLGNPTAPAVGSYNLGWNADSSNWMRMAGKSYQQNWTPGTFGNFYQGVQAMMFASDEFGGPIQALGADAHRNLFVSMVSGSLPGQAEAIDIDDTIPGTQRAGLVGALGLIYDVVGGNWERDPARVPSDAMTAEVWPLRVSFNEYYDYNSGNWQRVYGGDLSADAISAGGGGADLDNSLNARAALLGHRGNDTFDRLIGTKETGLNVSMISGSWPTDPLSVDTELPAAAALADATANPTVPGVGSHLMIWDEGDSEWDRARSTIAPELDGIAEGTVSPALAASAFGMGFDPVAGDWNRIRLDAPTGAQLVAVTGSVSVDSELPAALAAADGMANPTAPSVLAHTMGYNGVTWDRVYMGQSGSLAVDLVSQLDPVNDEVTAYVTGTVSANILTDQPLVVTEDEVTAYITGTTALNLMGKTIVRAIIDVSGSAAGEETLVAAVGGQKIKVLETMLIGNADVSVFFQSGFTGTALTGPLSLPSDGDGFFIPTPAQMEAHHFETIAGEALVLDIDANVLIGGWINYYTEA